MDKNFIQKLWGFQKETVGKITTFMNRDNPQPLRPMMKYLAEHNNFEELVGAEIGTQYGKNAHSILSQLPIKKIYLIDPYRVYPKYTEWVEDEYWMNKDMNEIFEGAQNRLSDFNNKIVFIKKMSSEAINDVPDNLDFVYIDGNHDYEFVKQDINLWFPKVKKGGVIGGHDMHHQGVARAFVELVYDKENYFIGNSYHPDWWLVK